MNLIQQGSQWLIDRLQQSAGVLVTYWRGSVRSAPIMGVPTKENYDVLDEEGMATSMVVYDWHIEASELLLGGLEVQPQAGDLIVLSNGDVYEVSPPAVSLPAVERFDTSALTWKIHTKQIERAADKQ